MAILGILMLAAVTAWPGLASGQGAKVSARQTDEARSLFEKVIATCPATSYEYGGAKTELKLMR